VSPVYGYRAGGLDSNGQPSTISRNFHTSLVINGSGATQSSTLAVMTSAIAQVGSQFVQSGSFVATRRDPSLPVPSVALGSVSSTTNPSAQVASVPTDSTGLPNGAYPTSQNGLSFDTSTGALQAFPNAAFDATGGTSYSFDQTVTPATASADLGSNHPTQDLVLQGYVGGIAQGGRGTVLLPSYIVTNATGTPGDVSIALFGSSSRLAATFNVKKLNPTGTGGELQTASLQFGVPANTPTATYDTTRGAYVDLTHFAALSQRTFNGVGSSGQETTTINGVTFANGQLDMMLVNAQPLNVPAFFPSVAFCQCDYTQWGMWSAEGYRADPGTGAPAFDTTGIAFWVAGQPAAAGDVNSAIANNVTATYSGHVIASIANGPNDPNNGDFPAQYIAAANFSNVVNFGSRSGVVSIPDLDGASYGGSVTFGANPTLFSGTLNTGPGDRTMALDGSFFKGATSPVGEMGGSVTITGNNYLGSGIFAAKMH
jgi:hypothetical protein